MSDADSEGELGPEQQLQRAIHALLESGIKDDGLPKLSFRAAGRKYGVPRSTLQDRWHGAKPRREAHVSQQLLTPAQEKTLAEWIKEQARRGIPDTVITLAEKASEIVGYRVGLRWAYRFKVRHNIVSRWSRALESLRAGALNRSAVESTYTLVEELCQEFSVRPQHIWNPDEKGVQDGAYERVRGLVDRNQKTLYQVENGGRNLTTIIECVNATGRSIRPTIIFRGQRLQKAWFQNNPGESSISCSPNGWTDNELGSKWVEKDFDPQTREGLEEGEWRMLILDGHNSHCSLKFLTICERKKILVVCLPPHTTHALQPCDVGVFGPLSRAWAKTVREATRNGKRVLKENIPALYHAARQTALTESNIISAWRKTGLYPLDRSAIPDAAYAPALNTTTKAALPIPVALSEFLVELDPSAFDAQLSESPPVPIPASSSSGIPLDTALPRISDGASTAHTPLSSRSSLSPPPDTQHVDDTEHLDDTQHADDADNNCPSTPSTSGSEGDSDPGAVATAAVTAARHNSAIASYEKLCIQFKSLPRPLSDDTARDDLVLENQVLRTLLERCREQLEVDHVIKKLMELENEKLRNRLFNRKSKAKREALATTARHLTSAEAMEIIGRTEHRTRMKDVFKQMRKHALFIQGRDAEKNLLKQQKEQERATKAAEKAAKDAQKAAEKALKDAQKAAKEAERERSRQEKAVIAEQKRIEREAAQARKAAKPPAPKKQRTRAVPQSASVDHPAPPPAVLLPHPTSPGRSFRMYTGVPVSAFDTFASKRPGPPHTPSSSQGASKRVRTDPPLGLLFQPPQPPTVPVQFGGRDPLQNIMNTYRPSDPFTIPYPNILVGDEKVVVWSGARE